MTPRVIDRNKSASVYGSVIKNNPTMPVYDPESANGYYISFFTHSNSPFFSVRLLNRINRPHTQWVIFQCVHKIPVSYTHLPIFPNERRIALRCRKKLRIVNGQRYDKDYHFLCQTANTTWAGKFGDSNSYESNKRTPASAWKEYYDSPIIYFAISNKQYK